MSPEFFSTRYNLRGKSDELIYQDLPNTTRTGLLYLLDKYSPFLNTNKIIKEWCETKRIPLRQFNTWANQFKSNIIKQIRTWIEYNTWWEVIDLCEIMSLSFYKKDLNKRGEFSKNLNSLFKEEGMGYQMQEGKIERISNEFTNQYIQEASKLLKDEKYLGAQTHFAKAIQFLDTRPNPDVENCIKDAVSAIESVGRVIVGDEKALLNNIIDNATKKGIIPKPLDQTFQKVYAYRGNEPGVAHGAVDLSKVSEAEAELILAISAAMIIYLVKKRNQLS